MPISVNGSENNDIIAHPGYLADRYYQGIQNVYTDTSSALGLAVNSITYVPFPIYFDKTIIRIAISCSTSKANADGRFAIYSNLQGIPFNLLGETGNMAISTTGAKEAIVSIAVKKGWYWLAGISNITPYLYCATSFLGSNNILGQTNPTSVTATCALRDTVSLPYSSFPTTAPIYNTSLLTGSIAPLFWLKFA